MAKTLQSECDGEILIIMLINTFKVQAHWNTLKYIETYYKFIEIYDKHIEIHHKYIISTFKYTMNIFKYTMNSFIYIMHTFKNTINIPKYI
jgi:hypothetical protein